MVKNMKRGNNRIVKKAIAYLLLFALCVPLLGAVAEKKIAEAKLIITSSDWNWNYTVNDDGTAEICGKYLYDSANLVIPAMIDGFKVTSIADKAFYEESSLSSVTIPDGVTKIGSSAFFHCSSLSKVVIPDSVAELGALVFWGCDSLSEIVIPEGVPKIGYSAFYACPKLSKIVIPDSVTDIGAYAFCGCDSLREIVIPDSVKSIGTYAFWGCDSLRKVVIPDSVTRIGDDAFKYCHASLVIYAVSGSYAETYANRNGITVKTDAAINPVVTSTPIPISTPMPTPGMGATFAPIVTEPSPIPTLPPTPTPTLPSIPTLSPTPTPTLSPTPTPTPAPTATPTPELGISVSQTELSADAQGVFASNKVDLIVTSSYSCTVSTSDLWLKVCKKNASASADNIIWLYGDEREWTGSFYVFANENTSVVPRTGEITIKAEYGEKKVTEKVVVKQEAGKAVLTVSTAEITANAKGKTSVSSVKVDTNKTGGFSVSNDGNSWIKVGSNSYGDGAKSNISYEKEGTFYVFVSENPSDEARTGQITVTHEDGETKETIAVKQEGVKASLTVDSTSKTADSSGYFYNNAISVKTSRTGAFTATVDDAEWLKVSTERNPSFADGMDSVTLDGDGYIYLVADKNSGEERTATITISHAGGSLSKTVTVTQLGKAASYLEVDREAAYFDEPTRAIDGAVHISASEDTKWTVTSSESWIKILKNNWSNPEEYASIEGTGAGTFYILVKENDTYEERSGYITISAPGLESHEIYVQQAENEVSLDTLLQELTIRVTKKTFKKGKTTQIKLNYPEGLYASDIKSVKFSSNKKKVATVNSKGVVKGIKKGKAVITVKVTLENGSSKTFKAKITVDKRKVKLSKFK